MAQSVLILGGGVGGLAVANSLRKKLPEAHRITLIERDPEFVFAPSFLWVLTGDRTRDKISRPIERLTRKGIDVVRAEVESIDAERRLVRAGGQEYSGDYIVITLGAELAPEAIPGLAASGHNFYSLAGAETLRDALLRFERGRIVVLTAVPAYKCPAAPYEAAMLIEWLCRKRKVRTKTVIEMYAAEPGPMGVAGPDVSKAVREMVEAKGVRYFPQHQVTAVDATSRSLKFANGAETTFDVLAFVPPHRAPRVVRDAGLVGESGYIAVDRGTLATKHAHVFAFGDVVSIPLALGKPLPKAGVFAQGEAEVVANNIAHEILGKGRPRTFDGAGECFIETGDGKAGFGKGNFYAEPLPLVKIHKPNRAYHAGKVLLEKYWLTRWF